LSSIGRLSQRAHYPGRERSKVQWAISCSKLIARHHVKWTNKVTAPTGTRNRAARISSQGKRKAEVNLLRVFMTRKNVPNNRPKLTQRPRELSADTTCRYLRQFEDFLPRNPPRGPLPAKNTAGGHDICEAYKTAGRNERQTKRLWRVDRVTRGVQHGGRLG